MSRQLLINFPRHKEELDEASWIISAGNNSAFQLINSWPKWSSNTAIICGPSKSGKTHLCDIWRRSSNAIYVKKKNLRDIFLFKNHNNFIIDNLNNFIPDFESDILHLFNKCIEDQCFLLMTYSSHSAVNSIKLPDLRSRLIASFVYEIESPPDEHIMSSLLVKNFERNGISITYKTLHYIITNLHRSYEAIYRLCNNVAMLSLDKKSQFFLNIKNNIALINKVFN